jgi:putative acetyltransferase
MPDSTLTLHLKNVGLTLKDGAESDIAKVLNLMAEILPGEFAHGALLVEEAQKKGHIYSELETALNPTQGCFWILQDSEQNIVGSAALKQADPQYHQNEVLGEIVKLYLHPRYRGHGLGRALTQGLIAKARALGYRKVFLATLREFTAATRLYRELGFVTLDENRVFKNCPITLEMELMLE